MIIKGIGTGMISTMVPVVTISVAIMLSYLCANGFDMSLSAKSISVGLYGIGIAAVGMLSTLGITLATDAYGPIADNAGGNSQYPHQADVNGKYRDGWFDHCVPVRQRFKGMYINMRKKALIRLFAHIF